MTSYVLIKIGFDSMENCHATYEDPIAVFTTKEKLDAELAELKKLKTYRGYDGELYPKYRSVEVPVDGLPPTIKVDPVLPERSVDGRWLTDAQRACLPGTEKK